MTDDDDRVERDDEMRTQGERAALVSILGDLLHRLGYDTDEVKRTRWILERERTVAKLREVCDDFGDNDWPDDLNLVDVLEKHLAKHLHGG